MGIECTICGEENSDNATHCSNCGASLRTSEGASSTIKNADRWVIICPKCGHMYDVADESTRLDVCDYCQDEFDRQEIAHVKPQKVLNGNSVADSGGCRRSCLQLYELKKKKKVDIREDGVIGQSGSIAQEFFAADDFVSHYHCRVTFEDGDWKIEHIGHTNPTWINGIKLQRDIPVTIRNHDHLRIADLFFEVSIEQPCVSDETEVKQPKEEPAKNDEERWVVICPVCGTVHDVESDTDMVPECKGPCRHDDIDKYEIARIRPVKMWMKYAD